MPRITKLLGLSLALWAMAPSVHAGNTAAIPVSLIIRESCLIQTSATNTSQVSARPQVSCLHDAPSLTRLTTEPAASKDAPSVTTKLTQSTWLVMF